VTRIGNSSIDHFVPGAHRDPEKDLRQLLDVLEDAWRQGAIKDGGVDQGRMSGARLAEAYLILRRWWS